MLSAVSAALAGRVTQGQLELENIPEIPAAVSELTSQYENVRSASMLSWHPRGEGILIGTRFAETTQVHHVARPGAARRQLTFFDEPVGFASYSPDPDATGFVFSRDAGGAEFHQFYWMDHRTGRPVLLTDGSSVNRRLLWSNEGSEFAYVSTRRNGRDFDLYLSSMESGRESRLLLEREGYWLPVDWSPDDQKLILMRYVSVRESHLEILDLATGKATVFNARPEGTETIAYGEAAWSADGRGLFLVSDEVSEFQQLRHWNLETGAQTVLTSEIPWDVEELAVSRDRKWLAFAVNEGGRSALYVMDTGSKRYEPVEELPVGVLRDLEFSPDGSRLGFTSSAARSSGDVHALELSSGTIEQWTESETGGLNTATFVEPELIECPTFDEVAPGKRRMIPAWMYRPSSAGADRPAPVLILIHGGPEGQSRPSFSVSAQLYVRELGLAVIVPNVRGSTGYGKTYVDLDNGMKREDSVRDIGALLDWIGGQPGLNAGRVIVMGGSYGGYMSLACMTHFNDRLAAGIDIVGISNFVTFLTNTQDYRRDLRRVEYGDERDPEMRSFLERISPINSSGRVTKPMLIVQSQNDPRVPASESEQLLAALKKNGASPWYVLGKNEGHGFRKKENIDAQRDITFLFLQTVLGR